MCGPESTGHMSTTGVHKSKKSEGGQWKACLLCVCSTDEDEGRERRLARARADGRQRQAGRTSRWGALCVGQIAVRAISVSE
jgi:hypothetical protein